MRDIEKSSNCNEHGARSWTMRYPQGETCRVKEKLRLNKPQEAEQEDTNKRERELRTEGRDQAHRITPERLTHWIPRIHTRATKQPVHVLQTRENFLGPGEMARHLRKYFFWDRVRWPDTNKNAAKRRARGVVRTQKFRKFRRSQCCP